MKRFQQKNHALGSEALMTVVLRDDLRPEPIFAMLWNQVYAFEKRFSRFLPDSELSRVNQAAGEAMRVTPEFRKLLAAAQDLARRTQGLYNPLILPALQRAGYKGSWPHPEQSDSQTSYEARRVADWQGILVKGTTVQLPANSALDFGGIGKGYLLDTLADFLMERHITNYWLSLGGDIVCAGYDEPGDPWRIGIQDAWSEAVVAYVANHGQRVAVATSGITKRKGVTQSGAWHHIIDPSSGAPAHTDVVTATVYADSATQADVAAKVLVIAGSAGADAVMHDLGVQHILLQLDAGDRPATIQKMGTVWSI